MIIALLTIMFGRHLKTAEIIFGLVFFKEDYADLIKLKKSFTGKVVNTNFSGSYRQRGPETTSISEFTELEVSIYPNPAANDINLKLANIANYDLSLYSSIGENIPIDLEY